MVEHAENVAARVVVDAAYKIHKTWGPGLLESAYSAALEAELRKRGHQVDRQPRIPVMWEGVEIADPFRADFIVDRCLIVELKSVERTAPVHAKQVLTYLKLSRLRLGLLINFGAETLRDGTRRIANGMP